MSKSSKKIFQKIEENRHVNSYDIGAKRWS